MGMVPSQLTRIRTFRDDVAKIQTKGGQKPKAESRSPVNPAPRPPAMPIPKRPAAAPAAEKMAPRVINTVENRAQADQKPPAVGTVPKIRPAAVNEKLAKEISAIAEVKPKSILSQEGRVFDVMDADDYKAEGSIITDRKRKRFKLLPAMAAAFKEWFSGKREAISEFASRGEEPVATVRPARTREEIVAKAFKQSALAPKDDYQYLAKRLSEATKERPARTNSGTLTIKKSSEVAPPSWTYLEDEEETAATVTPPAAVEPEEPTEEASPTEAVAPAVPEVPPSVEEPPKEPEPQAEPEPAPAPVPEPPAPSIVEDNRTPPPYRSRIPQRAVPAEAPFSIWRVGAVILLAVLLGVSGTLWFFGGGEENTMVAGKDEAPSLISAEEQIAVPIGRDAQSLMRDILSVQPKSQTVVAEIYPEINISGETVPAGAAEVLAVLDPSAPGTFIRAVTDMSFGLYRNREPFIVMKFTSFDAALGGMLEWEVNMSSDLSPLFGAPVSGTFDPQARTATQIREPYFTDMVVGNYDARILLDETQKERLAYTFLNRNTVLITTNRDALVALAGMVR